jgi:hypothetical protein
MRYFYACGGNSSTKKSQRNRMPHPAALPVKFPFLQSFSGYAAALGGVR